MKLNLFEVFFCVAFCRNTFYINSIMLFSIKVNLHLGSIRSLKVKTLHCLAKSTSITPGHPRSLNFPSHSRPSAHKYTYYIIFLALFIFASLASPRRMCVESKCRKELEMSTQTNKMANGGAREFFRTIAMKWIIRRN